MSVGHSDARGTPRTPGSCFHFQHGRPLGDQSVFEEFAHKKFKTPSSREAKKTVQKSKWPTTIRITIQFFTSQIANGNCAPNPVASTRKTSRICSNQMNSKQ